MEQADFRDLNKRILACNVPPKTVLTNVVLTQWLNGRYKIELAEQQLPSEQAKHSS